MQYVRNLIDNTKAKAVLSFFDTCHSGAVARNTHTMLTRGMDISGEGKILIAACLPEQTA
ncbi:hypothetical protein CSV71_02270 [Sporosarcina sp. P21c]|nr:hypothetical protein CSV71_02270 [Sporosarcina sp. P21c]